MANRPIFIPDPENLGVQEVSVQLIWHSGFAPVQKKKNIHELHRSARQLGFAPILEVSTKSECELGRRLSAFNLKVHLAGIGDVPLESAFQGSKVFEDGGPYTDLYFMSPREARSDERLKNSGALVEFRIGELSIPLTPKTLFYDWLYLSALYPHREWLRRLEDYVGFSDIEFNPQRSINCQAKSCALFIAMLKTDTLDAAMRSPMDFEQTVKFTRRGSEARNSFRS